MSVRQWGWAKYQLACWKNCILYYTHDHWNFNVSFSFGAFPDSWKSSLTVPVPKPGDPSNPSIYRSVFLLPIVSKLHERHVCDLRYDHFSIFEKQWGFEGLPPMLIYQPPMKWFTELENRYEVQAVFFGLQRLWQCFSLSPNWETHLIRAP